MASWIQLNPNDLNDAKAAPLVAAYRSAALADGQGDPATHKIETVCDRIRAEIQACRRNQVSATPHSIPKSLKDLAMRLVIWEMQSRLGDALPPSDQDKTDHRDDLKYLERIAKCDVTIETPDDPLPQGEVQRSGSITTTEAKRSSTRVTTRDRLAGF
jgi:hypothetical protein